MRLSSPSANNQPQTKRTHTDKYLDSRSVSTISGLALEICITAAAAALTVKMLASFLSPF